MTIRHRAAALVLAAAAVLIAAPASAEKFPGKTVRIIVPAAAGGALDIVARLVGLKMADALKTNVVIDNRAGGMGVPGAAETLRSDADGNTMMIISTSHTVAQALHPELFHFLRDFAPVTMIAKGPLVLAARPGFPAKTVGELVKLAKSEPGKLTYASGGGSGSAFHLCTELLQRSSGIRMLQVPYKSNAPALNDLVGGHVDLMFDMMVGIMGAVKGGQVTALAVTSEERSPALPDVPTMAEAGFPDVQVDGWWGFIVPAGTPPEAIAGIRKAVGYALAQADVQKRLAQLGAQPLGNSGEEFGKKLKAEIAMWAGVIKDAGVKPEKK